MRPRANISVNYNHDMNTVESDTRKYQCDIHPQSGVAGEKMTVIVYGFINVPVKLSFNQLVLPTERKDSQGMISLLAEVPTLFKTRQTSNTAQIYLNFMSKDNPDVPVRQQYIGNFIYKDIPPAIDYTPSVSSSGSSSSNHNFATSIDYNTLTNTGVIQTPYNYQQSLNDVMPASFPSSSGRENTFMGTQSYGNYYRNTFNTMNSFGNQQVPETTYYNTNTQLTTYPVTVSQSSPPQVQPMHLTQETSHMPLITTSNSDFQANWNAFNNEFPSTLASQQNMPLEYQQLNLHRTNSHHQHVQRRSPYRRVSRNLRGYGKTPIDFNSITLENYSPYPDILNPVRFNILGDITTMLLNWSHEENRNHRRLVKLARLMDPYGINCGFEATCENTVHEHNKMIVSCIQWPGKDTYWITSVDCINLAEFLLSTRFDVDYKNCIRRNLEGFGPTTVSKTKPDSVDFFKLIMGFNHPKPRNIEKDIKVFQWHILPFALKKIITKYKSEEA
ncbi:hypothetical protein G6F46_010297 [Rhizopus delemar]|uniref:DUF7082 domain-containing protein n=1 Tax=Rhizopus delemar (strain RA 99-880 / ATCC MYA-4621 / FGSC 9543 / NRRL 43880) TaxID=246409 RepID=I1BYT8_RHIO9|nr:hypothetical protein RO3G_06073 [Rhizopus delemar RA 99-880]KAG1489977.1 hypothetical protein G6F54_011053 [Rhizopus delemar]KAG1500924.1 hypothetical protein G6F53_011200 [Rhizopus delemar]KAG1550663.1 hypothetical protein G6F49_009223 [Rhizopus delemar]KAG1584555.1 hypothetical protein G6F47_011705 [Rhizopus delemar]|eukprot:EIE81368.1 hypothetical protein RO3G_06073 [Rhizopus delemar RA 99-880]